MKEWILIISTLVSVLGAESFADWMAKDYCDRPLAVGQIIMNNAVVASDERTVKVFRGTEELVSGSIYHHSESLTVSLSDTHDQYLYEATGGAKFEKGGCEGKRIADKKQAILKMPLTGEDDIKIVAGWALGHEAVNLTPTFVLVPESWNDRRADLPDATSDKKTDSKHDSILKDSTDHGAGDLSVKGGKSEADIAAPQEDLYAHELQHHDTDSEHDHHLSDHHEEHNEEHHEEHHEHEEDHHQLSIRDDPEPHEDLVPKILTDHMHITSGHTKLEPHIIAQREHDRNHLHSLSDTDKHFKIREDFLKNHHRRSDADETDLTPRREGESKEAMRDDDIKHAHDLKVHNSEDPHSHHHKDHDVFDLERKKVMDRLRDRALFRGDIEGTGSEKLRSIVEQEMGRHNKGFKILTPKVALRGGSSYSSYVRSHSTLLAECFLAGTVFVFLTYRIFASRFKIQRYFKKIKGEEEK